MEWHSIKEGELLARLKSRKNGLTEEEVKKRLAEYGINELVKIRKLNAIKILLSQFESFLVIMLIIAAAISALISQWIDFGVILAVVFINSLLGFLQEYKAEKALENLREMLVPKTKVFRDKRVQEIDAREIVPGDILVLSEGDKVMADARIIESENLEVNEASLTGESLPQEKEAGIMKAEASLVERTNMIYQGTEVVQGNCKALVVLTGMKTEFGKIAELVQEVKIEKNPLREKIDGFARTLGIIAICLIIAISAIGFLLGLDKFQIFFTAVSLAVSSIPSGLPAVITITLAFATQRMLKLNTIVRKLPAAETLGRATFICTDKTGTITEEKIEVKKIYVNRKMSYKFEKNKETQLLFRIGVLCNNARIEEEKDGDGKIEEYLIGDPTEKALLIAADKYGIDKRRETEANTRVREFPFSSRRKMMAIVREGKNGYVSYVKGAPEIIIEKCNSELINGRLYALDKIRKEELIEYYKEIASEGMRVLAFAYKPIVKSAKDIGQELAERNLVFVGLQGMIDPPRKGVKEAIRQCEDAGIRVIMITGDSDLTALAVGEEIGLKGDVITSMQIEKMSDQELSDELYHTSIFARVSPEDKLRIVEILKRNKEIVAMTGDGVNDAPALKKADIGIAVGRGTDVTKDSSDMILLDNDFASIVRAVKEGRRVYDNIKKFITLFLSANFDETLLIVFAIFLSFPLPLLPLHILWMNLITDSLPALALSTEKAEEDTMKRKPSKEGILKGIFIFVIIAGMLGFLTSFFMFYLNIDNLAKARTMALTTAIIFEMFLVFNCRTKASFLKSRPNKYIIYAVIASITLQIVVLYTPLSILFKVTPIGLFDWLKIIGICIISFFLLEIVKIKMRR